MEWVDKEKGPTEERAGSRPIGAMRKMVLRPAGTPCGRTRSTAIPAADLRVATMVAWGPPPHTAVPASRPDFTFVDGPFDGLRRYERSGVGSDCRQGSEMNRKSGDATLLASGMWIRRLYVGALPGAARRSLRTQGPGHGIEWQALWVLAGSDGLELAASDVRIYVPA